MYPTNIKQIVINYASSKQKLKNSIIARIYSVLATKNAAVFVCCDTNEPQ